MLPPPEVRNKPVLFTESRLSSEVDCVSFEIFQGHKLERGLMGAAKNDARGLSGLEGFQPAGRAQTPAVSWFQTRKSEIWVGRRQIVAAGLGKRKKRIRHLDADRVQSGILRTGVAAARPVKSGERPVRTGLKGLAKNVFLPFERI